MKQIRVYNQVFRIEKTVYSIQGVHLPLPVSYRQMAFFVGSLAVMIVLNRFPPLSWVDYFLVKFVGVPALTAWFFTRKTLDGKAPHRFIFRWLEHAWSPHHFARYREIPKVRGGWRFEGLAAYRRTAGRETE
jgi:hypothetical protein